MDRFSFLNAVHSSFIEDLYQQYLKYPDSIEPSWKAFFQGFDFALEEYGLEENTENNQPTKSFGEQVVNNNVDISKISEQIQKEFKVLNLIEGYRTRGHLFTKTNPVRDRRQYSPTLAIENYGLTSADLGIVFNCATETGMKKPATLKEIIDHLNTIYCDAIGVEYVHIKNIEERDFIRQWIQKNDNHAVLSAEEKKHVLQRLNQAVAFESYLNTKFVGQKRFSLEGVEALIPALDQLFTRSSQLGVDEIILGMAHRGRLNVLTNIFQTPYKQIFSQFESKEFTDDIYSGDVKYHLGASAKIETLAKETLKINLVPNPSHLEAVGAVAEGITRAQIDHDYEGNDKKILPVLIHGDSAIAGQGVVYEVVQMMSLDANKTGGTVHIVTNNQVGFTTNYLDARSSTYCTDVAKVTDSPVMHVNADDVESVVHAMHFAADFRNKFGKDVFIDLLGYRKYGHNEGDEPKFTQPKLYKIIAKHPNPREIYKDKLIKEGVVSDAVMKEIEEEFKNLLDENFNESKEIEKNRMEVFMADEWKDFPYKKDESVLKEIDTTFDLEELKALAVKISTLPEGKNFFRKIDKLFKARLKMIEDDHLDWAMGELLAYATLLKEGYRVRLSGEDSERGTFSHRHAVLKTVDTEEEYVPLAHISDEFRAFQVYNTLLSEYAGLGFDYGYGMVSPKTLTLWEAQFGDFANGAQIIIDQYIAAAEEKWKAQNGLVMLLPHGAEGQGAEHSSARLERFLTLCANQNMIVANATTPANFFHLLRRQLKSAFRKPLIVMTPKSLLRHPRAVSTMEDLAQGTFQTLIDDATASADKVERLVMCSGKLYYELLEKKEELKDEKIALVRLEQLYPLDKEKIDAIFNKYAKAKEFVWAQEEPENMGAWTFILKNFRERNPQVIATPASGSPAPGSHKKFEIIQNEVINKVFHTHGKPKSRPVTV